MKTIVKFLGCLVLVVSMVCVCGVTCSCASTDGVKMNQPNHKNSKVIKSNYKVKGSNRSNSKTYHAY